MCFVNTPIMAAPPELEKLLKDVKLTVGEGVRMVTEDEMKAMMQEGQPVEGEPDFVSNNGRIEPADKWAQTTPEKLATTADNLTAGDQKYYVLAYTLPGVPIGEQARSEQLSVKVSGFFTDIESGRRHIKKLHRLVPEYNLTLEKLYEWTAVSEGTVLGNETRVDALKGIMGEYHTTEHEYRQKQLERMQAVKQAANKGEAGPIHEDYKDIHTEISYGEMDPESDDPRLLEDRPVTQTPTECEEVDSDDDEPEAVTGRKVLRMQPDPETVSGQEWFVLSYVVPGKTEAEQTASRRLAIKVSGGFRTADEANDHAGLLMDMNPFFAIKVVKMYNFVLLPVSSDIEKKVKHRSKDKVMEEIMGEYYGTEHSQKHAQIVETIELVKAKEAEERAKEAEANPKSTGKVHDLTSIVVE